MLKKYFTSIIMIFILAFSLVACNGGAKNMTMEIKSSELTEKEDELLKLMEQNNEYKIYDYKLDDKIKSIYINFYILNSNGQWDSEGGAELSVKSPIGRIAISTFSDNGNLRIACENQGNVISWISNSEVYENSKEMSKAMSWEENSEIIYEKEIPLVIQTLTDSNELVTYGVNSFYDTNKLKGNDIVNAITVTFSEKETN